MPLVRAKEWAEKNFESGSRPSSAAISQWIARGEIEGRIIGRLVFVESDTLDKPARTPKPHPANATAPLIAGRYRLKS